MSGVETLAVLGAVASSMNVVSFSVDVVKWVIEGYRTDDVLTRNGKLHELADRNAQLSKKLKFGENIDDSKDTEIVEAAQKLAKKCQKKGEELRQMLASIDLTGDQTKLQRAGRSAKAKFKQPSIESMEKELRDLQQELTLFCLSTIAPEFQRIHVGIEELSRSVDTAKRDGENFLRNALDETTKTLSDTQRRTTEEVSVRLNTLEEESSTVFKQRIIIDSLDVTDLREREERIEDSAKNTVEWAFNEEHADHQLHLLRWLEEGDGIFWVSGGPGSGKSTFMKHVANHGQTRKALECWAGEQSLVRANFFFWLSGYTSVQKTQEGLLRALLWKIFRSQPSLIAQACPERWNEDLVSEMRKRWKFTELKNTLDHVIRAGTDTCKFCFFIDGLDEYKGKQAGPSNETEDVLDLVRALNDLANHHNVKICTSSRRRDELRSTLNYDYDHHLDMQQHSSGDIRRYTRNELEGHRTYKEKMSQSSSYDELVDILANRADGVWLWVKHAIKDVYRGLSHNENVPQILARVTHLPEDLEALYERDLQEIDQVFKPQAARIYLMSLHASEPIPVLTLYLAGLLENGAKSSITSHSEEDYKDRKTSQLSLLMGLPDLPARERSDRLGNWSDEDITHFMAEMQGSINGRCQEFLAVQDDYHQNGPEGGDGAGDAVSNDMATRHRLVFRHRTYRDFLAKHQDKLFDFIGRPFKVNQALIKSYADHIISLSVTHQIGEKSETAEERRETFRVLFMSMLFNLTQLQCKTNAPLDPEEDSYINSMAKIHRFRHGTASKLRSAAPNPTYLIKRTPGSLLEQWERGAHAFFVNQLQHFLADPGFVGKIISREALETVQYRQKLQSDCANVDPTGSLWTTLHVIPALMFLEADVNQMRGRASVWSCWLRSLQALEGAATPESNMPPRLRRRLRDLTLLLQDHDADKRYWVSGGLREEPATDVIKKAFGAAKGTKYLSGGSVAWMKNLRTNLYALAAFLYNLATGWTLYW